MRTDRVQTKQYTASPGRRTANGWLNAARQPPIRAEQIEHSDSGPVWVGITSDEEASEPGRQNQDDESIRERPHCFSLK